MTDPIPASAPRNPVQLLAWVISGLLLLFLLGLLLLLWLTADGRRPLKPFRPSPTPVSLLIGGQPEQVSFPELNEDPFSFQDRRIRVTGRYTPQPTACTLYTGPPIQWALIADELQLDAAGLESVLRLVPPGTTLTVEGIWRQYRGPLGCGKGPPPGVAWYLAADRIIQPNPLPAFDGTPRPGLAATPTGTITGTIAATATPTGSLTPSPTPSVTGTPTPSLTPGGTTTATPTLAFGTPSPTPTLPATALTATATQASLTPTGTPAAGTPTSTPTGATPLTPTATTEAGPTPPLATATPGGYPGPTPTATVGGYP